MPFNSRQISYVCMYVSRQVGMYVGIPTCMYTYIYVCNLIKNYINYKIYFILKYNINSYVTFLTYLNLQLINIDQLILYEIINEKIILTYNQYI